MKLRFTSNCHYAKEPWTPNLNFDFVIWTKNNQKNRANPGKTLLLFAERTHDYDMRSVLIQSHDSQHHHIHNRDCVSINLQLLSYFSAPEVSSVFPDNCFAYLFINYLIIDVLMSIRCAVLFMSLHLKIYRTTVIAMATYWPLEVIEGELDGS